MSARPRELLRTLVDYSILPLFLCGAIIAAKALQKLGVPNLFVTPLIVGPFAAAIFVFERARPERSEHTPFDLPLWQEAAHFIFNFEFGYGLALLVTELFDRAMRVAQPKVLWPTSWPMALQILLAAILYESTSYWQHRALHRFPSLWRFHALHHSGERLNFVRAVRFHFTDIGTAAFASYIPLAILHTPDGVVTLLAIMLSIIGMLQHANIRMRTPAWLDRLICTPAVHRHHHSRLLREGDTNFGNTVMIFDLVFRSYGVPHPVGPPAMGIENDPVPRDFLGQWLRPLRRRRDAVTPG